MDSLAVAGSIPQGVAGAVLMTLGMFLPAFALPIVFHHQLERLSSSRGTLAQVLDSVAATVVGLIAITALQLLRTAVTLPLDAVIFGGALQLLYGLPHRYTPVLLVVCAAMAGQELFYPYSR
jgi:chromate transporter